MTLLDVATRMDGMDTGNLSRIERDLQGISIEKLGEIATILGVQIGAFFSDQDAADGGPALVPVVGEARLGTLGTYEESHFPQGGDGWVQCNVRTPGAFALRCVGNSMRPKILPRHYVVIEPKRKPTLNHPVAVRLRDGRQMIKVLSAREDGFVTLTSYNEDFAPEDLEEHQILEMYRVNNVYPPDDFISRTDG